ncbi:MAG: hypothetical protein BGN94_24370 [Rhizobiales bacterium 68-8]|nr:MAG: hypothetical protein BGN94_24370 [Rhizobiales bacterium 68-8]
MSDAAEPLAAFRDQFAVTQTMAYFSNGSITPAARAVVDALHDWQDRWTRDPQVGYRRYPQLLEQLRAGMAALLGCEPDEVAITDNTSRGSILAVRALADRKGSHVLVDRTTYPSSRYPWLALTGKSLAHVDDGGADGPGPLASRITDETCAVSVSHVDWFTGVRHDVEALATAAHRKGAVLIVDGSQSVGAVPVDVRKAGIDVLVGTFGKWLLGGPGLGFVYMRRSLLEAAPMVEPGWRNFVAKGHAWPMDEMPERAAGARIFEPGLPNINGLVAAQAGLDLVLSTGVGTIASAISALAGRARNGLAEIGMPVLTPADPARRAGLLAFPLADAPALAAHLRERGVEITGYPYGHVRIDPHAYNTAEEVGLMLDAVSDYMKRKGPRNG